MTATTIPTPTPTDRSRRRGGVAAASLALGSVLGVAGAMLFTGDDAIPARPAVVQRPIVNQPVSRSDRQLMCRTMSADAAERCVENQSGR